MIDKKNSFEKVVAGALLKFKKVDSVDIKLLIEDIYKIELLDCKYFYSVNLSEEHVKKTDSWEFALNNKTDIDITSNYLSNIAGSDILKYMKILDIEKFKIKKERILEKEKSANVLLISDNISDYNSLVNYGFKCVDYFKSIIRANNYFKNHPKELEKYHIILKGNQNVQNCHLENETKLDEKVNKMANKGDVLLIKFSVNDFNNQINACFKNYQCFKDSNLNLDNHFSFFDKVIENSYINNILSKKVLIKNSFHQIKDYVNPNKIPLPKSKKDLKILYLEENEVGIYSKKIANKLGLDITFRKDNNCGLGRYVKEVLGDYDIIIASDSYSSNLLNMNFESTEQCKDTGRTFTMLCTYRFNNIIAIDEDHNVDYTGFGNKINLKYVFGGELSNNVGFEIKKFRVLRSTDKDIEYNYYEKYNQSRQVSMQAIIESVVYTYNEYLKKIENSQLKDLNFKNPDEYDSEYNAFDIKENSRIRQALEPIKLFDEFKNNVNLYLKYKKNGFIQDKLEDLKIVENDKTICVENFFNDKLLSRISYSKNKEDENIRIFSLKVFSKNCQSNSAKILALYTRKYEQMEDIPNKPNKKQMDVIKSTFDKVNRCIKPLNDKAFMNSSLKDEEKKLLLENRNSYSKV